MSELQLFERTDSGLPCCPHRGARGGACFGGEGDIIMRFALWRKWADGETMGFVMLNPSIADAEIPDPTIRRCIGFAQREGCGGLEVCNLSPLVSTDPSALLSANHDIGREQNAAHIKSLLNRCSMVVLAYGAFPGKVPYLEGLLGNLADVIGDSTVYALGKSKEGYPKHPLYLRADAELLPYDVILRV